MLVILSDLHLNDGTCGTTLAKGSLDLLSERLCDLAWRIGRASCRERV